MSVSDGIIQLGELSGLSTDTPPPFASLGVDLRPRIKRFGPVASMVAKVEAGEMEIVAQSINQEPVDKEVGGVLVTFEPGELFEIDLRATGDARLIRHTWDARVVHTDGEVDTLRFSTKRTKYQGEK